MTRAINYQIGLDTKHGVSTGCSLRISMIEKIAS